jgi:hypothetical protein
MNMLILLGLHWFRTVQDYMGLQTTGNNKRKIINP